VETVIDCVVAPVDQTLLLAADDVSTTFPPAQKVVGPPAVIVGTGEAPDNVTTTGADVAFGQPDTAVVTVYVPPVETVIDCVVAPVDHVFPEVAEEVSVTLPPGQNESGPLAEIVGVAATITATGADGSEVHPAVVCVTV